MRYNTIPWIVSFILFGACVDRISFDVGQSSIFPVVIDGYISDQPGPYTIEITKAFDIESKTSFKTPISVKRLEIFDDLGYSEVLTQIRQGLYQTDPSGIQGTVGRAYTLRVELLDGRVYESTPDTLVNSGVVDSVYYNFKTSTSEKGATSYGFDVFFDSNSGNKDAYYFLWKFIATFQVETNPELFQDICGQSRCPKPRLCSGFIVNNQGQLEQVEDCECCTCWSDILNDIPIVSNDEFVENGQFKSVKAGYVPVNKWTFLNKVHAQVQQRSLSRQAFSFWKAVKAQKEATSSIFQPVSGKIKSNFIQISGQQSSIEGLFYATSIVSKSVYITRDDVPNQSYIPPQDLPFRESCLNLFPNSTTQKPAYWE